MTVIYNSTEGNITKMVYLCEFLKSRMPHFIDGNLAYSSTLCL